MHTQALPFTSTPSFSFDRPFVRLRRRAWWLLLSLRRFLISCADQYAASVQYADLANLSDVELERRGFARGDLHRHVADTVSHRDPGALGRYGATYGL